MFQLLVMVMQYTLNSAMRFADFHIFKSGKNIKSHKDIWVDLEEAIDDVGWHFLIFFQKKIKVRHLDRRAKRSVDGDIGWKIWGSFRSNCHLWLTQHTCLRL